MVSPMKNNMKNRQTKWNRLTMGHPLVMMKSGRMMTGSGTQMRSGLSPISQMLKQIASADAARAKVVADDVPGAPPGRCQHAPGRPRTAQKAFSVAVGLFWKPPGTISEAQTQFQI